MLADSVIRHAATLRTSQLWVFIISSHYFISCVLLSQLGALLSLMVGLHPNSSYQPCSELILNRKGGHKKWKHLAFFTFFFTSIVLLSLAVWSQIREICETSNFSSSKISHCCAVYGRVISRRGQPATFLRKPLGKFYHVKLGNYKHLIVARLCGCIEILLKIV